MESTFNYNYDKAPFYEFLPEAFPNEEEIYEFAKYYLFFELIPKGVGMDIVENLDCLGGGEKFQGNDETCPKEEDNVDDGNLPQIDHFLNGFYEKLITMGDSEFREVLKVVKIEEGLFFEKVKELGEEIKLGVLLALFNWILCFCVVGQFVGTRI